MPRLAKWLVGLAWVFSALAIPGWFLVGFERLFGRGQYREPFVAWYYPEIVLAYPVWGGILIFAATILLSRDRWQAAALTAIVPLAFMALASERLFLWPFE